MKITIIIIKSSRNTIKFSFLNQKHIMKGNSLPDNANEQNLKKFQYIPTKKKAIQPITKPIGSNIKNNMNTILAQLFPSLQNLHWTAIYPTKNDAIKIQPTIRVNIAKHHVIYTVIKIKHTKQYGIFVTKPKNELSN